MRFDVYPPIGINFEQRIIGYNTMIIAPLNGVSIARINGKTYATFFPEINLEYRYYYNYKKRLHNGKDVEHNAANYLGILSSFHFGWFQTYPKVNSEKTDLFQYMDFGPIWGIQRNFGKHFYWNMNWGIGFRIYQYENPELKIIGNWSTLGFRLYGNK